MRQYRSNGILRPVGIWLILAATACAQTIIDWTPSTLVPDNNPVGVTDTRNITFDAAAVITGLEVRLNLSGGWNGDLYGSLVHDSGFTVLLNRPGNTLLNPAGSGSSGMNVTFSHSAANDIHTAIPNSGLVTGTWQPDARTADPLTVTSTSPRSAFLSSFNESPVQGNWTLFLADNAAADTSMLNGWGLTIFSEIRPFAIWDSNSNTSGIGGVGTWTSSGSTWATSAVGTSTAAQTSTAQLVFQGAGGNVNVSGTVSPANGLRFATNGYSISGGTIQMSGANAASNSVEVGTGVTALISSTLTGTNGMSKTGAGTLNLSGDNTYTGVTTISGGTLQVGAGGTTGTMGNTSSISVASGATLKTNRSDSITLGQAITGAGNVEIANTGSGSTILGSASNAYSGTTTVTSGSLQVGSSGVGKTGTGAVTVQTGSVILGSGMVQGASFTAESGSTVHAGDTTATADINILKFTPASGSGTIDFQSGSSVILGINPGAAQNSDLLEFIGTGTSILIFNGNLTIGPASLTPTAPETFNLLDWSGFSPTPTFASRYTYTGLLTGNNDEASGLELPNILGSGFYWDISLFTTNGSIAIVVPEPSRALLLLTGLGALVLRRRRSLRLPYIGSHLQKLE